MGLTCGGETGLECETLKASLESGAGLEELARKMVRLRERGTLLHHKFALQAVSCISHRMLSDGCRVAFVRDQSYLSVSWSVQGVEPGRLRMRQVASSVP